MSRQGDRRRAARYARTRRGELGLSQDALADKAGVDVKTIRSLESGERWPVTKSRQRIEGALEWAEGDLTRTAEGGYPVTGPLPEEDLDGLAQLAGTDEFEQRAREVIAGLSEPERSVVEEVFARLVEERKRSDRLTRKLFELPSPESREEPDDEGGESAAR